MYRRILAKEKGIKGYFEKRYIFKISFNIDILKKYIKNI